MRSNAQEFVISSEAGGEVEKSLVENGSEKIRDVSTLLDMRGMF